jgi:hypothetical protein
MRLAGLLVALTALLLWTGAAGVRSCLRKGCRRPARARRAAWPPVARHPLAYIAATVWRCCCSVR